MTSNFPRLHQLQKTIEIALVENCLRACDFPAPLCKSERLFRSKRFHEPGKLSFLVLVGVPVVKIHSGIVKRVLHRRELPVSVSDRYQPANRIQLFADGFSALEIADGECA